MNSIETAEAEELEWRRNGVGEEWSGGGMEWRRNGVAEEWSGGRIGVAEEWSGGRIGVAEEWSSGRIGGLEGTVGVMRFAPNGAATT